MLCSCACVCVLVCVFFSPVSHIAGVSSLLRGGVSPPADLGPGGRMVWTRRCTLSMLGALPHSFRVVRLNRSCSYFFPLSLFHTHTLHPLCLQRSCHGVAAPLNPFHLLLVLHVILRVIFGCTGFGHNMTSVVKNDISTCIQQSSLQTHSDISKQTNRINSSFRILFTH